MIIAIGKFHGVIDAHTPIGCFSTSMRLSVQVEAEHVAVDALGFFGEPFDEARAVERLRPCASASGLPCSAVISAARSSAWAAIIRSNQLRMRFARAPWRSSRARPARPPPPPRSRARVSAAPRSATVRAVPGCGRVDHREGGAVVGPDPFAVDIGLAADQGAGAWIRSSALAIVVSCNRFWLQMIAGDGGGRVQDAGGRRTLRVSGTLKPSRPEALSPRPSALGPRPSALNRRAAVRTASPTWRRHGS